MESAQAGLLNALVKISDNLIRGVGNSPEKALPRLFANYRNVGGTKETFAAEFGSARQDALRTVLIGKEIDPNLFLPQPQPVCGLPLVDWFSRLGSAIFVIYTDIFPENGLSECWEDQTRPAYTALCIETNVKDIYQICGQTPGTNTLTSYPGDTCLISNAINIEEGGYDFAACLSAFRTLQ